MAFPDDKISALRGGEEHEPMRAIPVRKKWDWQATAQWFAIGATWVYVAMASYWGHVWTTKP